MEIGTEEIPASYIQPALKQMEERISKSLRDNRLEFDSVRTMGTPRRLVLSVEDVSTHQPDRTVEVMGPPKRVAYDEDGKPTKAAEGFARKIGVAVDDLKMKETERGEYVYFLQQELGKSALEILSEELPKLVSSLEFPKSMHFNSFEDGKFEFTRPIRWIAALLGEDVVDFSVGRVKSDRFTVGHRFLSDGFMELKNASLDDLRENLRKAGVVVDHEERRSMIRDQVTQILESEGCPVYIDEELLDTVTFLVEMPKAVMGTFSEDYLSLPVEVLETAMKKHQRYFSLRAGDSSEIQLLPKFITITNGVGDEEVVRHGNERVLRARLADAKFFYMEDQKSRLADKTDELKRVVFQEELGSLYDKAQRLKQLTFSISEELDLDDDARDNAVRAAELCKTDLITQMVVEFPSLQGIMGGHYAANSGETGGTAEAIMTHYYPTSPDGDLPDSITGSVVSIADKLDTIVGYFGIGNIPSGSRDPYALRRQAAGIVRILFEFELHLALDWAVEKSVSLYGNSDQKVVTGVLEFLKGRVSALLSEQGFTYDVIDSVLAVGFMDVPNTFKRAFCVSILRELPDFEEIYNAFNRVIRILPKDERRRGEKGEVDENLFQDQAERNLYESIIGIEEDVERSAANGEYDRVLDQLIDLRAVIDIFFDEVLVMSEQDDVKNNRLMLLKRLDRMFLLIADFSKLVE
jgi:tetrameric-type glycyl-tRNA synthetase beta subunit